MAHLIVWRTPKFLNGFKCESKLKTTESKESWHAPWLVTLWGLEGRAGAPGWDQEEWQASITHTNLHKTNTRWLVHNWNTFGARTSHMQTWTHKTHHGPNLGEATTFRLIVYFVPLHEAHIQMAFCSGTPKWESQNCQSWDSYDFGEP